MFADIVIFDANTVKEQPTFEHLHAYSTGYEDVLINQCLTVDNFKHYSTRNGAILRSPEYQEIK